MPKNKKKFIDKKKAVSFQLVHRSQQDPLVADEDAPQRILLPIEKRQNRIEEQHKYGIYFKDDTDYLQHLKDTSDTKVEWPENVEEQLEQRRVKLDLPPTVFASEREESEGMLSKAAPISGPQLHLDPDVVAAMDDDFDYSDPDNQLEDNFIEMADGVASDQEFDEEFEQGYTSDGSNDCFSGSEQSFDAAETKSRFTNHSMTSAVLGRNELETFLDRKFEKVYESYDEIGAPETFEYPRPTAQQTSMLLRLTEEYRKKREDWFYENKEMLDLKYKVMELADKETDSEDDYEYVEVKEKDKWDCQTILSTKSNIYNHPTLIVEPSKPKIRINKKTGVPLNVLGENRLTQAALDRLDEQNADFGSKGPRSVASMMSELSSLSLRPKDESLEDKRQRKALFKEFQRERRIEKKINRTGFKEAGILQHKVNMNKNNIQGKKIF